MAQIFFLYLFFLLCFIPSVIFAEGTDTTSAAIGKTVYLTEASSTDWMEAALDTVVAEGVSIEAIWFGYQDEITIATRHKTPIRKAPSIVTVITDEEIKNSGYRTFVEILRMVPGFEILKNGTLGSVAPAVRGFEGANKVRVMLNGHFVNNPLRGDAFTLFDDFPVENIKRIEIIRGPGSAMYGENAFLAVINIVTFDAKNVDGVKVSSGYGSFDTKEGNITFGKSYGAVGISGLVRYRETDGFDGVVESDVLQNRGRVQDWRREYDLNLKITYKGFYGEGLYINKNQGPFIGPQLALNDGSDVENNYVFAEVGYRKTFEEKFTLKPRIYYDQFDRNAYIEALPEGATISLDTDGDRISDTFETYPDGFDINSKVIERVVGTEIPFDYKLFDGNLLTLGTEYRLINQDNTHFLSNVHPVTSEPLDSLQNFSDSYPQIDDATRHIWSFYMQDAWDITDALNLTVGVRHDQYSDFGGATSPRLGLTWAFMKNASLKLLYGEAFRAPSFAEMHAIYQRNSIIQGNEDLDPEIIRTYEVGLSYQFHKYVTSSLNYFNNDVKDLIVLRSIFDDNVRVLRYENYGDARVQGIEMETRIDLAKGNYLFMNYTFQEPEDDDGNDLPFVAKHKGNFGVNVQPWKYINTNISTFVSGSRTREVDDRRDDLPAYALVNLSLIGKEFFRTMEVQGTVFNLLDKDYSDPGPISIPDDLPRPGRTFFIGLSYQF